MTKLYIKQSVLSSDDIKQLMDAQGPFEPAGVYNKKSTGVDRTSRSASIKQLNPKDFPEVNKKLMGLLKTFNPEATEDKFFVKEYNYLIYNVGDHFKWHLDVIENDKPSYRHFSTTTVLSLSDDLEGGEFGIEDGTGFQTNVSLEEGETLLFDSNTRHKVYPVTKGKRVVLVAWIYNK